MSIQLASKTCLATLVLALAACPTDPAGSEDGGSGNGASSSGGGGSSGASSGATSSSSSSSGASGASSGGASGSGSSSTSGGSSASNSSSGASGGSSGGGGSSSGMEPSYIFAHTRDTLYRVDADTLQVQQLGVLTFVDEQDTVLADATMTDLAINSGGEMWGCGLHALYEVDTQAMVAHRRAMLTESYTGMTFVPIGFLDPFVEVLVGATSSNGSLYRIDQSTGATTLVSTYSNGWQTSGDIVAVLGDGMYATVKRTGETTDWLARIDVTTGQATIIGSQGVGATAIYGLGYWRSVLYGFNNEGKVLAIDRTTGVGSVVSNQGNIWWGAGVTTLAKVID